MSMPIVPETAPFTAEQRQWLNDFLARFLAAQTSGVSAVTPGEVPWHKPSLSLGERMNLADGWPIDQRMMAALAQQDCRQCGYDCESYASAIASSAEARLNLCVPGGKDTARMLRALRDEREGGPPAFDADGYRRAAVAVAEAPPRETRPGYHRDDPVTVTLTSRRRLSRPAAGNATYHVGIDLGGSGLDYAAGDALGIYPENDPLLVDAVLSTIQAPPGFPVGGRTLRDVLTRDLSLGEAPDALFELIACLAGGEQRQRAMRLAKGESPGDTTPALDVLGALETFAPIRPSPEALVACLEPLQPRLYSIASSFDVEPGRLELTVDHVRYVSGGRLRNGVASSWMAERAPAGARLRAYVQRAPHFRLPQDGATPIVMIGPGTGIAPFRAFLQERRARGATGPAWLFYGHRHEATGFLYRDEIEAFRAGGVLTRLSLAWSRDSDSKVYVQHRMIEAGEDLWDWLFDGAHLYVCGDAQGMAPDVERALVEIIADWGNRDDDAARAYLTNLKKAGRYQLDVY